MNKAKFFSRIIIILMTTSILLSLLIFPTNNYPNEIQIDLGNNNDENFQEENLKTSNKDLNYTSVFQNTSFIRRDFESLYFEVNVSQFEYANKTSIEIEFPNNTLQSFEMNYTIGTTMNFTYEYKPKGDAPLGFHRVRFIVKNISLEQLNTGNFYTNFTVSSTSWVIFNNSEYFRGECLRANILFLDISTNYNWKAVVVNTTIESQQNIIEVFFQDPEQITFIIDEEFDQLDYNYYLAINITEDDWNTWNVDYWAFYIKNSVPIIYENTIQFNPTSVFREERCDVQVSVNDSESNPSNVDVNIRLIDPNRNDAYTQTLFHSGNGLYKGNFTISGSRPKGIYEVEFEAIDGDGGNCTVFKKI